MYHAIAKDIPEYNGGSDLMRTMAQYVERKPKKYKVNYSCNILSSIQTSITYDAASATIIIHFVVNRNFWPTTTKSTPMISWSPT